MQKSEEAVADKATPVAVISWWTDNILLWVEKQDEDLRHSCSQLSRFLQVLIHYYKEHFEKTNTQILVDFPICLEIRIDTFDLNWSTSNF